MVFNVCPAAVSSAPPERFWEILTAPSRYGEWTDAVFVAADPAGAVVRGSVINLVATGLGRRWPVRIDVAGMDSAHRWIDLVAHLPFGVDNHEHLTLAETRQGGTLVRFN